MAKIGLVIEGGGMKCAYGAGVLDCFLDDHVTFTYGIGVSAGSANGVSYLAGQKGRNLRFYTDHIKEKGYMGVGNLLKTGNMFGLDYIYSTLTNSTGADALDYEKMMANPTEYELVTTNALTGQAKYINKRDLKKDNYQEIKASCAIPAACKPIIIDGIPYFDGGLSDPLPVDHALEHCDKVVVLTSKDRTFESKPEGFRWFYSRRCAKYPIVVDEIDHLHINYMRQFRHMYDLEKEGKAFIIAPSEPIKLSIYTQSAEKNRELYDLGVRDYGYLKQSLSLFMEG